MRRTRHGLSTFVALSLAACTLDPVVTVVAPEQIDGRPVVRGIAGERVTVSISVKDPRGTPVRSEAVRWAIVGMDPLDLGESVTNADGVATRSFRAPVQWTPVTVTATLIPETLQEANEAPMDGCRVRGGVNLSALDGDSWTVSATAEDVGGRSETVTVELARP